MGLQKARSRSSISTYTYAGPEAQIIDILGALGIATASRPCWKLFNQLRAGVKCRSQNNSSKVLSGSCRLRQQVESHETMEQSSSVHPCINPSSTQAWHNLYVPTCRPASKEGSFETNPLCAADRQTLPNAC